MAFWRLSQPAYRHRRVAGIDEPGTCPICKTGHLVMRTEELDFLQRSDKGPLRCRVSIPVAVCESCGHKTWTGVAETLIQEAVLREYEKLP